MLLLATRQQGQSTVRCCFQSTGPIFDPLPPPSPSPILWTRRLSSTDAYVVIFKYSGSSSSADASIVDVYPSGPSLIPCRLHWCLQYLERVVYYFYSANASAVVAESLGRCRRHRFQFPGTVNTPLPSLSETFTLACRLFCFLLQGLRCCC